MFVGPSKEHGLVIRRQLGLEHFPQERTIEVAPE